MRILLLAPVHRELEFLRQKGSHPFLIGQGQQSWVEALESLGQEVAVFRYSDSVIIPNAVRIYISAFFLKIFPVWKARFDRYHARFYFLSLDNVLKNRKLFQFAKKIRPEIVIISGGVSSIFPKTINNIKDLYGARVLLFSGINPIVSSTNIDRTMVENKIVDIVLENDRGYAKLWEKLGARKTIVLPISSVDPKLHRKVKISDKEQKEYSCDICFVGSLTLDRQEKLLELTGFDLKVWGDIPSGANLIFGLAPFYQGTAHGEKMVKIFNCAKIVLNFQPKDMTHGGNMRTFEILGCGAFQMVDKIDPAWFSDRKDLVLFKDTDNLKKKIQYYLTHEDKRLKIARSGYQTARKFHTYKTHFAKLLKSIQ